MSPHAFGDLTFGSDTFGGVTTTPTGIVYTIEIDFTTPLLDFPTNWTDITPWVRNFTTRRGRSHELGKMQAGEASLLLDNRDRRFDPSFPVGPYWPNVVPMRHARIRCATATDEFNLFQGFVEDWGQQWSGPAAAGKGDAFVEAHLVDAFKVLNLTDITSYPAEVLDDEPVGYWPMDDATGQIADLGSANAPMTVKAGSDPDGLRLGTASGPLAGGAKALDYTGSGRATFGTGTLPDDFLIKGDITVESWVWVPSSLASGDFLLPLVWTQGGTDRMFFGINGDNHPGAAVYDEFASISVTVSSATVGADSWHHVAWVRTGNLITYYIDGVAAASNNLPLATWGSGTLTVRADFGGPGSPNANGCRLAHTAVFPSALPAERIVAHYNATLGFLIEQPVDDAITMVLDAIGWDPALRLTTSSNHIAAKHIPEDNALTELQKLAEETDGGTIFARGDGVLHFRSAADFQTDTTYHAAWGDTTAELRYSDLVLTYDDADLWTEVRATAEGLADAVATDPSSAVTYGPRSLDTAGGYLSTQNQLQDRATGFLRRYSDPMLRPESLLAVDSVSQPSRTDELFASDIGRKVTVTRRPPGGGSPITIQAMIEGVSYNPTPAMIQCRTTLNLVPVLDPVPWVLGSSTYGVLGSTTTLGW